MPVTFERCIERAQQFALDEVTTLKLAAQFFEQDFKESLALERAKASANAAEQRANAAEKLVQVNENHFNKLEALWNMTLKSLNMDHLRARGLLSSRGVFEWFLRSVHNENPKLGSKFYASTVCTKLGKLTGFSIFFPVTFC